MKFITAKKIEIDGYDIKISCVIRRYFINAKDIKSVSVKRITSLFDEIGIFIYSENIFLVTERVNGFFKLSVLLNFDDIFGSSWYKNAEDGLDINHNYS